MVIDFHTHTFPDKIVDKAVAKLADAAHGTNYLSGRVSDLASSMKKYGIDYSVVMPIAVKCGQHTTINKAALEVNEHFSETGILSFGSVHPYDSDCKETLKSLKANGFAGIKLHPVYQGVDFDDPKSLRLVDLACENDLIITVHAGLDVSAPGNQVIPSKILKVIKEVKPSKLILAHTGGWNCWDEVYEKIAGLDVYFDTSYSLNPTCYGDGTPQPHLSNKAFCDIVKKHGSDHMVFGTDSPWTDQGDSLSNIKSSGLDERSLEDILYNTGEKLLHNFLCN